MLSVNLHGIACSLCRVESRKMACEMWHFGNEMDSEMFAMLSKCVWSLDGEGKCGVGLEL